MKILLRTDKTHFPKGPREVKTKIKVKKRGEEEGEEE